MTSPEPLAPPEPPVVGTAQAPWQPRVRALLEVLACSSVPTQMLISGVLLVAGMPSTDGNGTLSLPFIVTVSLADTAVLIALMVAIARAHNQRPSELWLGRRPALPEVWRGLALVPPIVITVMTLLLTLRSVAPWLHNVPSNPLEAFARGDTLDAVALGLVVIVAGGVREELQRAFVLQRFEEHLGGAWVGVVVTSVAFGAGHGLQGWDAAVVTGILGAVWAVLYLRRRSSIAPIVSHAGFNSLEVLRVAVGSMGS